MAVNSGDSSKKIRVCLIVEGAYPYVVGGVSVWLQDLITNLSNFEFLIWTIVPESGQKHKFKMPENVVDLVEISLSDKLAHKKRKRDIKSQWNIIHNFHNRMDNKQPNLFEHLYHQIAPDEPKALAPDNLFKDFQGWELMTKKYNINHPISPFIDYYWAWRSTHIPIFQMMQTTVPDADIYHAISTGYAGLLGAIAKVKNNKPFILTEHGIYTKEREMEINQTEIFKGYQKQMAKKIYHALSKLAYDHADKIIALFQRNVDIQIQMGAPAERCQAIPNGIRVKDFSSITRKPHSGFNVGFIGRMVPIKDVKNLLMASRIIKDEIPNTHFYLIGPTDEDEDYYNELLILVDNLKMKESITFTGRVDVKKYLSKLDVLCLSSIKEAQPLTLIEALIAGVPSVATDVGDVANILQDDGIVVPPKSPEKLAQGVIRFATDPAFKKECVIRGKERAIRDYDLDSLIQRYGDIYFHYGSKEAEKWQA